MSARLSRRPVRLLAAVCVAALCGAGQPPPGEDGRRHDSEGGMTLRCYRDSSESQSQKVDSFESKQRLGESEGSSADQVSSAVGSATESLVAELSSQRALLEDIARKLNRQDSRLDSLDSGLDSLTSRLLDDSASSEPDSASSEPDSASSEPDVDPGLPRDCSDLPADAPSGVHLIRPGPGRSGSEQAFCDMDTDGGNWTVFQRRADILPRQDFYQGWRAYRDGFGELDAEFWWGLQKLWQFTHRLDRRYELRVDLEDFDGEWRHAVYQDFRISPASDGFRMTGGDYAGDAGDSLGVHFGQRFTTKDKDQDLVSYNNYNCARLRKGAWWYAECGDSNLNGVYMSGQMRDGVSGVTWRAWREPTYSLKTVEMKIRPTTKFT